MKKLIIRNIKKTDVFVKFYELKKNALDNIDKSDKLLFFYSFFIKIDFKGKI